MTHQYDLRLVAYTPYSDRMGVLLPMQFSWTHARYRYPVMQIDYLPDAVRFDWMETLPEVALEVWDGSDWVEPDDCRMVVDSVERDRSNPKMPVRYFYVGIGSIMGKLLIADETVQDPGDGPVRPIRKFTDKDVGDIMVPLVNAAFARAFDHLDDPPVKDFALGLDSNEAAWVTELEGRVEFGITEPLSHVEELLLDCGLSQPVWQGRTYQQWIFGTYGRDFTTGGDALIIRDSFGITKAPERKDFGDLAARVLVVGEEGQHLWRENVGADTTRGILEVATSAGGIHDTDAMHRAARLLALEGEQPQEQLTREGVGKGPGPKPLRDFRCDDTLIVQRGNDTGERRVNRPCVELSVTRGPNGIRWHAKFSDRHEDRLARMIRRMNRMAQGTIPGPSGTAEPPGDDVRVPTAPTSVAVVVTPRNGPRGTTADQAISWLHDGLGDDGVEINLRGFQCGEKRSGGVIAMITEVDKTEFSWNRLDVGLGARDLYVRAVSKQGFVSAWSADVDGSVVEDAPRQGPGLVLDAAHATVDIRAQRATDAGAGFSWVLNGSDYEAAFTTTTPVLRYGQGGKYGPTAGRVQVQPAETYRVAATMRRVGGTSTTGRLRVRSFNAAGTATTTTVVTSGALGTSDTLVEGTWTAPAGTVSAELQILAQTIVGGAVLRGHTPILDRRASTLRIEDLAVANGKIANGAVTGGAAGLSAKIAATTITNANIVANTIRANEIAALTITANEIATAAITTPKMADGAATTLKIASGVDIDGTITTSSGLTLGGISSQDIDFPTGGDFGDNGSGGINCIVGNFGLIGNGTYTGTWAPVSVRESKTAIKPISVAEARRLLDLEPITFKHRDSWMREKTKRVIPARETVDRSTGKKKRHAKRVIPGRTDPRRYAGFIAEDVEAKQIDGTVAHDTDGNLVGSNPIEMIPYLLRLVQDQDRRIAELEARPST